jgi:ElaB/YqjD/DUF883 family membrane-anchored ribosome-binding protein
MSDRLSLDNAWRGWILPWQLKKNCEKTSKRTFMESRIENTPSETDELTQDRMLDEVKAMFQRAEEKAVERAKAADRVIRSHPYQTIGVAFGLGLLIGVLAIRRK